MLYAADQTSIVVLEGRLRLMLVVAGRFVLLPYYTHYDHTKLDFL